MNFAKKSKLRCYGFLKNIASELGNVGQFFFSFNPFPSSHSELQMTKIELSELIRLLAGTKIFSVSFHFH